MPLSSDQHIIDQQFSERLKDYRVRPSSQVWTRIINVINSDNRRSQSRKILTITAALLLMGSSAGLYESLHHSKVSMKKNEITNETPAIFPLSVSQNVSEGVLKNPSKKNHFIKSLSVHSYPDIAEEKSTKAPNFFATTSSAENFSVTEDLSSLQQTQFTGIRQVEAEAGMIPQAVSVNPVQIIQQLGSYYVGVAANFNSTWLLDKHALASNNLKYQFTFGGSYGLEGGYYFAKRWGIQTAWILSSWEGQKYKNLDIYGRTTSLDFEQKSISLTYMDVPLLIQYRSPHYSDLLNTFYNFNLVFGGQYGHLLTYRIDGEKGEVNSNQLFRHNEFAAVAGFDYDFRTEAPVFYTLGLRASLGTNIFNPGVPNYFEFSKPHNFIIGVHGAVNFGFRK